MTESELLAAIQLAHSRGPNRLFRFNAGLAWAGKVIEKAPRRIVLLDPFPVKLGPPGMSDLFGWTANGRVAAIEGKVGRRQATDEQAAFIELVRRSGGVAGVARTVEDAGMILAGTVKSSY